MPASDAGFTQRRITARRAAEGSAVLTDGSPSSRNRVSGARGARNTGWSGGRQRRAIPWTWQAAAESSLTSSGWVSAPQPVAHR